MEQRVYHGSITPEGLANYLVQHYDPQENLQAQKVGEGNSLLVQIGHGDNPAEMRHAVTVAIAGSHSEEPGVTVTMGQRQWITEEEATHAAFWGLLALLLTPWVLFALLWPLSEMISRSTLPADIWTTIDTYAASQGSAIGQVESLVHPHTSL